MYGSGGSYLFTGPIIMYFEQCPEGEGTYKINRINDIFVHSKWESYPSPTSQSTDQTTN